MAHSVSPAPSGPPEMFEADVGQRHVNFSWFPPPVSEHNGPITSYTLSCSPSPSSLPYTTSQLGPLTVTGFSPDTFYSCSVVASNGLGSGPPAQIMFTTLQDCKTIHNTSAKYSSLRIIIHALDSLFQIHLVDLLSTCTDFVVS